MSQDTHDLSWTFKTRSLILQVRAGAGEDLPAHSLDEYNPRQHNFPASNVARGTPPRADWIRTRTGGASVTLSRGHLEPEEVAAVSFSSFGRSAFPDRRGKARVGGVQRAFPA